MAAGGECTIVLTVLEGRHFPKRAGYALIVEGRFDGEVLFSDPVPHDTDVSIQNELAWVLTKRALQQHRVGRSPIKLQVLAVQQKTGAREHVGYVVLDVRAATADSAEQWHPLLNTKYRTHKPELKLLLALEGSPELPPMVDSQASEGLAASRRRADKPKVALGPNSSEQPPTPLLQSVVDKDEQTLRETRVPIVHTGTGVCHVGTGTARFRLAVTISFLQELECLASGASSPLPSPGLFVHYSLLGARVTTRSFPTWTAPPPGPERAVLQLLAAPQDVEAVLLHPATGLLRSLQLHLCAGDRVVATASIPLAKLGATGFAEGKTVDGVYAWLPTFHCKLGASDKPSVGVSVTFEPETSEPPRVSPTHEARPVSAENNRERPVSAGSSTSTALANKLQQVEATMATMATTDGDTGGVDGMPRWHREHNVDDRLEHLLDSISTRGSYPPPRPPYRPAVVLQPQQRPHQPPPPHHNSAELDWLRLGSAKDEPSLMTNTTANEVLAASAAPAIVREGAEYHAAVELELWKRAEEEAFRVQLGQKEETLMRALAEEWRLRDAQREALTKRKIEEYTILEEKLSCTLKDVERRERKLLAAEDNLAQREKDLLMEHSRKLAELQDGGRRLQEDMAHAVALERTRTADALSELTRVTEQKTAALLNVKKIEAEFAKFRTTQANTPEAQLQGEITHLTRLVADFERKLAAANQAKKRFAEQWKRALHELGKVKTREQEVNKAQLRKEQHELQHMRLQYMAREERDLHDRDQSELEQLKEQVAALRASIKVAVCSRCHRDVCICNQARIDREAVQRLKNERDQLLSSGVYVATDPLVQSLAARIAELEA